MGFWTDAWNGIKTVFSGWLGSEVAGAIAAGVLEGAVVGAVTGAAVAAISGEDIGDGALNGAIVGGVTYGVIEGVNQWSNVTPDTTFAKAVEDTPEVTTGAEGTTGVMQSDVNADPTGILADATDTSTISSTTAGNSLPLAKEAATKIVESATSTSSLEKAITDLSKKIEEDSKFDWGSPIAAVVGGAADAYGAMEAADTAAESAKELMAYQAELDAEKVAANQPVATTSYKLPSFGVETTFLKKLSNLNGYSILGSIT